MTNPFALIGKKFETTADSGAYEAIACACNEIDSITNLPYKEVNKHLPSNLTYYMNEIIEILEDAMLQVGNSVIIGEKLNCCVSKMSTVLQYIERTDLLKIWAIGGGMKLAKILMAFEVLLEGESTPAHFDYVRNYLCGLLLVAIGEHIIFTNNYDTIYTLGSGNVDVMNVINRYKESADTDEFAELDVTPDMLEVFSRGCVCLFGYIEMFIQMEEADKNA